MDNQTLFLLFDSLQELLYSPADKLPSKAIEAIDQWAHPLAIGIEVYAADGNRYQESRGRQDFLDLLSRHEKRFRHPEVRSVRVVIGKPSPCILARAAVTCPGIEPGYVAVAVDVGHPLKHLLGPVLEAYANSLALSLVTSRPAPKIDLEQLVGAAAKSIGVAGVDTLLVFLADEPVTACWAETAKCEPQILSVPSEFKALIADPQTLSDEQKIRRLLSLLPSGKQVDAVAAGEFKVMGRRLVVVFGGKPSNIELVRSLFRNALIQIDRPTTYDELVSSFYQLRQDHDVIVKAEKVAAILETAVAVNHEVNNPLTAILGNTQLLLLNKEKLPPEIVSKIEIIEKSALRIRQVTQKLLSVIEPVTTPYAEGLQMLDIDKSSRSQ